MKRKELAIDYVDQITKHKFHLFITDFKKPENINEYSKQQKILDQLIDEIRDNEKHPLMHVMEIIGENLERYDDEKFPPIGKNISPVKMVQYLMETNHLFQKDLASIFGGQANVSKFLAGERELTKKQIAGLKKKFGISADFFI